MEFGISTHLYHGERLSRRHLEAIKEARFDLVEIFATTTHIDYRNRASLADLACWLDDTGLRAWSVHAPITDGLRNGVWGRTFSNASKHVEVRDEAVAETIASIEAAQALGVSIVVLHVGIPTTQTIPSGDNDASAAARALEPIARACMQAGVRLAIEVIPNALATAEAVAGWLEGELDLGRSGACLDVGHAHLTGGAPEAIERLSGHILTTHLHDNRGQDDDHLLPFEGSVDWTTTMLALAKVGYAGPLVFELPDHGDSTRTLARAVDARARIQAILDSVTEPFPFTDDE